MTCCLSATSADAGGTLPKGVTAVNRLVTAERVDVASHPSC